MDAKRKSRLARIVGWEPQAGFVLVLVMVSLIILIAIGVLALSTTRREMRSSADFAAKTKALYEAEGALQRSVHSAVKGYIDNEDPRFIAFDPLDPQGVFQQYVDDPSAGLSRYLKSNVDQEGVVRSYLLEGKGIGTVDYKVLIRDVEKLDSVIPVEASRDDIAKTLRFGRKLTVESEATHRRGAKTTVSQQLILSYLPNVIFKYGMLTNRLKECQFCHMHIRGDIGQVSGEPFQPISPHVTKAMIQGNFYLKGDFALDKHPAHPQIFALDGYIVEQTVDQDIMPTNWPSLLSHIDPQKPRIAGFYIDMAERAHLKGNSVLEDGEILMQQKQPDRFYPMPKIRSVVQGNVIAQGSKDKPLRIRGPVVIQGDLIIRGYITGQGSLYVERNIYVIGDVRYLNRPTTKEWDNVYASELKRRQAEGGNATFRFDKLGLFAGGNVIIGNLAHEVVFRYVRYFLNYESSGRFTAIDQREDYDPLGVYAMDGGSGLRQATIRAFRYNDRFEDGSDYDGDGKKEWGEGMQWLVRQGVTVTSTGLLPQGAVDGDFAGGWISQKQFNRLATENAVTARQQINQVSTIDATIYTDGAFTGYKPSNDSGASEEAEYPLFVDRDADGLTFNGAVIARDIDVLAPGGWYVRYDNRNYVGEGSTLNFEPSRVVELRGWREE